MAARAKALPGAAALAASLVAARPLRIALYVGDPPAAYTPEGECEGEGYPPGGLALVVTGMDDGRILAASDVQTEDTSIEAASALLYDVETGRGLAVTVWPEPIRAVSAPFVLEIAGAALLLFVGA